MNETSPAKMLLKGLENLSVTQLQTGTRIFIAFTKELFPYIVMVITGIYIAHFQYNLYRTILNFFQFASGMRYFDHDFNLKADTELSVIHYCF